MRPLLAEHCYGCHSAKAEKVKAGLRVDSREGLLQGGASGPALVVGRPERSRLIEAVRDPGQPMFAWRRIADLGPEPAPEAVAARWREIRARTQAARPRATPRKDDIDLADFGRSGFRGWYVWGRPPSRGSSIHAALQ